MDCLVSDSPSASPIYVIRPNGRGLRRITSRKAADEFPAWSPDSRKIVFGRAVADPHEGGNTDIFVIDVGSRKVRRLTRAGQNLTPAWSPDGKWIAWSHFGLWVMRPDGTHKRHVIGNDAHEAGDPAWSPDSRWIAFVPGDYEEGASLEVVHPSGRGKRVVVVGNNYADGPSWSPRGSLIAFTYQSYPPGDLAVFVVNRNGNGLRRLTSADWPSTARQPRTTD